MLFTHPDWNRRMPFARPLLRRRAVRLYAAVPLLLALAACNPARIQATSEYHGAALPRPQRVLVRDFALTPEDVRLDQGIRARLTRMTSSAPPSAHQMEVARGATATLAETLAQTLRSYGIPAERSVGAYATPGRGATVLVDGQVVAVDEGNRTRRTLIGLGAGKSSIETDTQLFYQEGTGAPRLLQTFTGTADSGHAPGAAETMGAGGAAGSSLAASAAASAGMHGVSERRAAAPNDLARKTAEGLARSIGQYFVAQGWLAPGAVK